MRKGMKKFYLYVEVMDYEWEDECEADDIQEASDKFCTHSAKMRGWEPVDLLPFICEKMPDGSLRECVEV